MYSQYYLQDCNANQSKNETNDEGELGSSVSCLVITILILSRGYSRGRARGRGSFRRRGSRCSCSTRSWSGSSGCGSSSSRNGGRSRSSSGCWSRSGSFGNSTGILFSRIVAIRIGSSAEVLSILAGLLRCLSFIAGVSEALVCSGIVAVVGTDGLVDVAAFCDICARS
jgi:hypothetical protein